MSKQTKRFYRFMIWLLAIIMASATFVGCGGTKYGAPPPNGDKYGPPPASGYNDRTKGQVI